MTDFAAHTSRIIARLGQPVTVTPALGSPRQITAVFAAAPLDPLGVHSYGPQLRAEWADVSDLAIGDPVTVGGFSFTVADLPSRDRVAGDVVVGLQAV